MKEHDLLTIKEFSSYTGISESTLRYYDRIEFFQPIIRGANGYRYYSAPQTIAVNFINVLNRLNIPLKTISEMQRKRTPKLALDLLHKQELILNRELFRLQQAYAVIHAYCEMIHEGLSVDEQVIGKQWMDAKPIELGAVNDFSSGYFYDSFFLFIKEMSDRKLDPAFPVGGYYENMEAFSGAPGRPDRFFSLTPTGRETKEAGEYLVGCTKGYYGNTEDLSERMKDYAAEHRLTLVGPVYELYLHDEVSVAYPDQYLIQVSVQVKQ